MQKIKITSIYRVPLFFCCIVIAFACENLPDEVNLTYQGPDFVRFLNPSATVSESGKALMIPVARSTADLSGEETITFSTNAVFTADNADASGTFNITSGEGQIVIPAGQAQGFIILAPVDNPEADGAKQVTLELQSSSSGLVLGFPGSDGNRSSTVVNISDDDCTFDLPVFTGSYLAEDPGNAFGFTSYSVSLSIDPSAPNRVLVEDFHSLSELGVAARTIYLEFDPDNLSVGIPAQELQAPIGFTGGNGNFQAESTAVGSISTCDGGIEIAYVIFDGDGAFGGGTLTLSKE